MLWGETKRGEIRSPATDYQVSTYPSIKSSSHPRVRRAYLSPRAWKPNGQPQPFTFQPFNCTIRMHRPRSTDRKETKFKTWREEGPHGEEKEVLPPPPGNVTPAPNINESIPATMLQSRCNNNNNYPGYRVLVMLIVYLQQLFLPETRAARFLFSIGEILAMLLK